jgi:hypothetical protein
VLRERFTTFIQRKQNRSAILGKDTEEQSRPIPGKRHAEPVSKEEWEWVTRQLETVDRVLFAVGGGCSYCHREPIHRRADGLPAYAMPQIPERWFCYSRFSHEVHRPLDCLACHAGAPASKETSDVLMPNIEQCRQCHKPYGGARSDCAECHLYHQRPIELNGKLTISGVIQNSSTAPVE